MSARRPTRSLRLWLTASLLCIIGLPPLAVWAVHVLSATTSGPGASTVTAARAFAADGVLHWTDPAWQATARDYFAASDVEAELRPARGPWFLTGPVAPSVPAADKFVVRDPGNPAVILGSGWVVPRTSTHATWALPLAAGALALIVTVTATGVFLGRAVVRPLAAMARRVAADPHAETAADQAPSRVREVAGIATALQAMGADLRRARQQQAEMEEQRRQFIGAIAHDLRTPLFTLRAYLDGLNDGIAASPQKASRYLQVCRASAGTLDRLVTDLFTYARMEFLDQRPQTEPLDLAAVLRDAIEAHRPGAEAKDIALSLIAPAGPCRLTGDGHLLTRVADNLLSNALRHTPAGGRVVAECSRTGAEVTFTVTDTGPGIPQADLPHVFTPLYRGEASRSRATGGAGLGLAIAHRIILAHHGTLTVHNLTPSGACFTARIPAVPPAPLSPGPGQEA